MRRRRRPIQTFTLSFLDCICCGFGAVILLFVLTAGQRAATLSDASATLDLSLRSISEEVASATANLLRQTGQMAAMETEIAELEAEIARSQGEAGDLEERLEALRAQRSALADAIREAEAAIAAIPDPPPRPGRTVTAREYFTEFQLTGQRVVLILEGSGGMMANTLAEAMILSQRSEDEQRNAPKWRRARASIRWLTDHLSEATHFQLLVFNQSPQSLAPEDSGGWARFNDRSIDQALSKLDDWIPRGGAHFETAFAAAAQLRPAPDNIILVMDGLPTQGPGIAPGMEITEADRRRLLQSAVRQLPPGVPVNMILFPHDGDPHAALDFWNLAIRSRGSLVAPAPDWPLGPRTPAAR
jgi:hypothetical protein